jgi:hypothetical protein
MKIARKDNEIGLQITSVLDYTKYTIAQYADVFFYRYSIRNASDGISCAEILIDANQITMHAALVSSSQVGSDLLLGISHGLREHNSLCEES